MQRAWAVVVPFVEFWAAAKKEVGPKRESASEVRGPGATVWRGRPEV